MSASDDRGEMVRDLWRRRAEVGHDRVYTVLMDVWDWEHNALCEAFGSIDALASALQEVAPPLKLEAPLKVWRGATVHRDDHPAEAAIGLSWTMSFDVACWFATALASRPWTSSAAAVRSSSRRPRRRTKLSPCTRGAPY
jgi:hypothetical protein